MTRLAEKNIIAVKSAPKFEHGKYTGHKTIVILDGGCSQMREYDGDTWDAPMTVISFINKRKAEVFSIEKIDDETDATTWIWRK